MSEYILVESIDKIDNAAKLFIERMNDTTVFAFNGKMGAGKTTFINAICRLLGVDDNVNSPTFSIVNEYLTKDAHTIYHMDCYRITTIEEALDIGIEEYLYSGNYCFIEWSENIAPILPDYIVTVTITEQENESRIIELN